MQSEAALTDKGTEVAKSLANHLLTFQRIVMGIILVGCGICGFLDLLPHSVLPSGAADLGGSLLKAGFMYPLLKGTEVLLQVYVNRKI
jgi:hypothetical protein